MARAGSLGSIAFCLAAVAAAAGAQERHTGAWQPGQGGHGGEAGRGPGAWHGGPGRAPGAGHGAQRAHPPGVRGPERGGDGWRGDIRHFRGHDSNRWQQGRWFHGAHGGRSGWWWIVGPSWYLYLAPVYPYPDPYQPPALADIAPPPPPGTPPRYWYYCADPPGYYPYVAWCRVSWRAVPAYPPG